MTRLTAMLAAVVLLVGVSGCADSVESTVAPLPRTQSLNEEQAAHLIEGPMETLATQWSTVQGAGAFEASAKAKLVKKDKMCFYRSTVYVAKGQTSNQQEWEDLAAAAQPLMDALQLDTSTWVDEHAAVGGGLVARSEGGAIFTARPVESDDAESGTFNTIKFSVIVPVTETKC